MPTSNRRYEGLRRRPGRDQHGFSLVELLVALVLMSLVLSFLPGLFQLSGGIWQRTDELGRQAGQAAFRDYLRDRIAAARPISRYDVDTGLQIFFQGEPDHIRFVAPASAGPGGSGLHHFEVAGTTASSSSPAVIELRMMPFSNQRASGPATGRDITTITHRVPAGPARIGFRYFGRPGEKSPAGWHTHWTRPDILPELVEVTITELGKPKVPPIVIALKLGRPTIGR